MECVQRDDDKNAQERYRWVFIYRIDGDLRFISHLDTMRLFKRALARAEVPLRFSQGFNPQPRLSLPLPRPVGIASDADAITIETDGPIDVDDVLKRFQRHTPKGMQILSGRRVADGERIQPSWVRYRVATEPAEHADLQARIRELIASEVVHVERTNPKGRSARVIDIRPYLDDLCREEGGVVMDLFVTGHGTARPAEVAGLLGFDATTINHRIRRLEVRWQP